MFYGKMHVFDVVGCGGHWVISSTGQYGQAFRSDMVHYACVSDVNKTRFRFKGSLVLKDYFKSLQTRVCIIS